MVYLKSLGVGLAAIVVAAIATVIAVVTILAIKGRDLPADMTLQWDPISIVGNNSFATWIVLIAVFALGFYWEYQRLTR